MILPAITTVGNTITVNSKERGRKSYQQDRSAAEPTGAAQSSTQNGDIAAAKLRSRELSLLKESLRRRQQVVVEKIAIACRLQLFVSLCGGIIKVKENTKIPRLPHAQTPEKAFHTSP